MKDEGRGFILVTSKKSSSFILRIVPNQHPRKKAVEEMRRMRRDIHWKAVDGNVTVGLIFIFILLFTSSFMISIHIRNIITGVTYTVLYFKLVFLIRCFFPVFRLPAYLPTSVIIFRINMCHGPTIHSHRRGISSPRRHRS